MLKHAAPKLDVPGPLEGNIEFESSVWVVCSRLPSPFVVETGIWLEEARRGKNGGEQDIMLRGRGSVGERGGGGRAMATTPGDGEDILNAHG